MDFATTNSPSALSFSLIFREAESSVDVSPKPVGGITSILVNYLQLEIDDEGTVLYPWGLFNDPTTWQETPLSPVVSVRSTLVVNVPKPIIPGVSRRLNEGDVWQAYVNRREGWICLGEPSASPSCRAVEFAPNSVAVLDRSKLVAVWLRPASLPKPTPHM